MTERPRRDGGFTLTELLVVVVVLGVLSSVVAASIVVVLRNEGGIARAVGESHDLQQAVNYLPSDIGVAPSDPAAYSTGATPMCGTGVNVLSISYPSGSVVSYAVQTVGAAVRLDRSTCEPDSPISTLNVADLLDPEAAPAASAQLQTVDGHVTEVALTLTRAGAQAEVVTGVPRAAEPLPDAYTVGGSCSSDDPFEETQGFLTFVEASATLSGTTQIYKAIGIGGELTFHGAQVASHGGNDTYRPASVGLYATSVNWAGSSGTLVVEGAPTGHVVLTDEVDGVDVDTSKNGSVTTIREYGSTGAPEIKAQHGQLKDPNPGHTLQFASAFTELRACSEAMAQLPNGCDVCAVHAVPLHVNANAGNPIPYAGTGDLKLDLTPGVANVLNIGESRLAAIGEVTPSYLDVTPSSTDALIINVIDDDPTNNEDGESVVRVERPLRFQNHTTNVVWNFAGIDRVELPNGIWGAVFAPFSTVTSGNNIQGNLVGQNIELSGGVINEDRAFSGVVRWG